MSFCPSEDVHSIYLDNEMPEIYVAEYEAHLKNCPKCQAKLDRLKKLHQLLKEDSESLNLSKDYMEKSFERLNMKLAYSKHTHFERKGFSENVKYFVPLAAAAAILALVLPVRFSKLPVSVENPDAIVAANSQVEAPRLSYVTPFGNTKSVILSGNVHETVLPALKTTELKASDNNVKIGSVSDSMSRTVGREKIVSSSSKSLATEKSMIMNVDLLRPDFGNDKTVSIKISVPGMNMIPVTTEIELPVDVFAGLFE